MRRLAFVAFGAAALLFSSAGTRADATTIVQTDTEVQQYGFDGFNSNLGTLNSVTLQVDILQKYRDWLLLVPSDVATSREVTWSVDGQYVLFGYSFPTPTFSLFTYIPISGSGTATVDLTPNGTGNAYGLVTTMVSGAATYSLDPADFVFDILQGEPRFFVTGDDTGYYDASGDTTFTVAGDNKLIQLGGECNGFSSGDDGCGWVTYTLTYDYSPAGEIAGVPEPATWAMMLIGFGAIGWSSRRNRQRRLTAA